MITSFMDISAVSNGETYIVDRSPTLSMINCFFCTSSKCEAILDFECSEGIQEVTHGCLYTKPGTLSAGI